MVDRNFLGERFNFVAGDNEDAIPLDGDECAVIDESGRPGLHDPSCEVS